MRGYFSILTYSGTSLALLLASDEAPTEDCGMLSVDLHRYFPDLAKLGIIDAWVDYIREDFEYESVYAENTPLSRMWKWHQELVDGKWAMTEPCSVVVFPGRETILALYRALVKPRFQPPEQKVLPVELIKEATKYNRYEKESNRYGRGLFEKAARKT